MSETHGMVGAGSMKVGYRFQRYWDTEMAAAFYCGELGAGLFFVSLLMNFMPGMVLGMVIAGVGKTSLHLAHMGQPLKSWRAIVRPDRSWVSRGLIAIIFMVGFGVVHMLNEAYGLTGAVLSAIGLGAASPAIALIIKIVAAAACPVVMIYQGLAMSHSSAIALWSSGLMPMMSLIFALLAGLSVLVPLNHYFGGINDVTVAMLRNGEIMLLLIAALMVASHLHGTYRGSGGGKQSVRLLLKEMYAPWFIGLVLVVGLLVPLILIPFAPAGLIWSAIAAVCILAGYFTLRVLLFKAGVFEPVLPFSSGSIR